MIELISFSEADVNETCTYIAASVLSIVKLSDRVATASTTTTASAGAVTTTYTYDANGSQTNDGTHKYIYNLQNKLKQVTTESNSIVASYVYDADGDRVQETIGSTTTYYLTDTNNLTGYAQPIEQKSSPTAVPQMSYILGDRALGQATGSTVSYLLTDGHGSTRELANASGTITATFDYDAWGTALNFNVAAPATIFLFGGDAVFDPASGLYFHGDGVRERQGYRFLEMDPPGNADNADPLSLHTYLYVSDNPVLFFDPSGNTPAALLGTSVHSFLSRAFESYTLVGGPVPPVSLYLPGSTVGIYRRWANREIRTTILALTPGLALPRIWPLTKRPDFVEYDTSAGAGQLYELKPGALSACFNPAGFLSDAADAVADVGLNLGMLTLFDPTHAWSLGNSWASGVVPWPSFPFAPPGEMLVTYNAYSIVSGAILYDFLPSSSALKVAHMAVFAAAAWLNNHKGTIAGAVIAGIAADEIYELLALYGLRQAAAPGSI